MIGDVVGPTSGSAPYPDGRRRSSSSSINSAQWEDAQSSLRSSGPDDPDKKNDTMAIDCPVLLEFHDAQSQFTVDQRLSLISGQVALIHSPRTSIKSNRDDLKLVAEKIDLTQTKVQEKFDIMPNQIQAN